MDIRIEGLEKAFGAHKVLKGFSATFPAGETTCIMGRSGCGKTTLLRILMGLETADGGRITGVPRRLSVVFQENRLLAEFSAERNAALAAGRISPETVRQHLQELSLGDCLHTPAAQLSGGMQRRIAIARAVLAGGDLFLLDEPFQGLDAATHAETVAYLRRHTAGKTVLLVTHHAEEAEWFGGRCIQMP